MPAQTADQAQTTPAQTLLQQRPCQHFTHVETLAAIFDLYHQTPTLRQGFHLEVQADVTVLQRLQSPTLPASSPLDEAVAVADLHKLTAIYRGVLMRALVGRI